MFCGKNYIEEAKLKMKLIDADSLYERAYKLNLDYIVSDVELRALKRLLSEEPIVICLPTIMPIKDWDNDTKEQMLKKIKDLNNAYSECVQFKSLNEGKRKNKIKEEILTEIENINYAYNDCSKYTTIKNLLEELCEEDLH